MALTIHRFPKKTKKDDETKKCLDLPLSLCYNAVAAGRNYFMGAAAHTHPRGEQKCIEMISQQTV